MIKSCGPTGRILPLVMLLLAVLFPGLCTAFSTPGIDLLGLGTNVGAIVVASAEVMEDFESIGHGHGMMLLAGSKICREINLMREATSEGLEELGELKVQTSVFVVCSPQTLYTISPSPDQQDRCLQSRCGCPWCCFCRSNGGRQARRTPWCSSVGDQ